MSIYRFTCKCGCKGILSINKDVEYIPCPYCHQTVKDAEHEED